MRIIRLTDKIFHHLWCVMWRRSDAKEFIATCNGGIIDGLDVDVVAVHHDVTHGRVLLRIRNLLIKQRVMKLQFSV